MTSERAPFTREVVHPDHGPLGWLCVDSVVDGLAFGGFRMTPNVTQGEVEELARCMTLKLAAHGSPVGGAKAGIRLDPMEPDADALLAFFAAEVRDLLTNTVVLGKDMGATDLAIDGMYAALGVPQLSPMGSSDLTRLRDFCGYRRHMTGLGVAFAARAALGGSLEGARVAIQGAGLVGLGSAVRLAAMGAQIVGMSDVSRCLVWPEGVNVAWLEARVGAPRSLRGADQGHLIARDDLFGLDADVVVLAASSYSVGAEQVASIQAPLVVEGCNMGFVEGAREVAQARGLTVIPDVLASSSSAAMVCRQLRAKGTLGEEALWGAIEGAITQRVTEAMAAARLQQITVRQAHLEWATP
ncbi:MAG: Glu/Leu/Phe/Val dehydrogenase dimerization domain-containing protein [Myxococcota bacterium]